MEANELLATNEHYNMLAADWKWADALRHSWLFTAGQRQPFLVQGETEEKNDFETRAALTEYAPIIPRALNKVLSVALGKPPRLDKVPETLQPILARTSIDGSNMNEFVFSGVESAFWNRYSVALLDRAAVDAKPETAADDAELGIDKPYFVMYEAADVLDWRFGRDASIEYIKLRNECGAQPDGSNLTEIREVYKDKIHLWHIIKGEKEDRVEDKGEVLLPAFAAADVLPVAVCQPKPINAIMADSPVSEALTAEKRAFRLESDIAFDLYIAGHPWLKAWVDGKFENVGIGANKYIKLNPGNKERGEEREDLEWMEINGESVKDMINERDSARESVKAALGVSVKAEAGRKDGVANSGVQVAYEFNVEEGPTLKMAATSAERFQHDLMTIAAIDMGIVKNYTEAAEAIQVDFNKEDFGIGSADALLARAVQAKNLYGPDSEITKSVLKRAARSVATGEPEDFYAKADAEIDGKGAHVPEVPDFLEQ